MLNVTTVVNWVTMPPSVVSPIRENTASRNETTVTQRTALSQKIRSQNMRKETATVETTVHGTAMSFPA